MNTFFSKDNDRKHTSKLTKHWMEKKGILENVMVTPASSPDLNPIENIWSAMKTYLRSVVKPKKKDELVKGIHAFWKTLTAEKCAKYIDHVHRLIPDVILNYGGPTQFWKTGLDEEPWLCKWSIPLTRLTLCQNQIW